MNELPFLPQFRASVRDGRKTATSRTSRYGDAGDVLQGPGVLLRLTSVERVTLQQVQQQHWREEGVASPEEFEEVWRKIHPGRGWDPAQKVWLHFFEVTRGG